MRKALAFYVVKLLRIEEKKRQSLYIENLYII